MLMTSDRKSKLALYAVLMVVIIAGAIFQQKFSIGKIDRCEVGGGTWDHDRRVCVSEADVN
ncbi:hypothetical protein [Litorimonas sp. WD9-15]|uniref:hypothetical protein n=1 Tax=Litorimonas sp. WD9-15 TaxID=3418716 RepID=UPI003D084730